jgi:hypothetical protein
MKLNKAILTKLKSAFAYAQRKLKTAYHFTFEAGHDDSGIIMSIERTMRGDDDATHFIITANVKEVSSRSMRQLRRDAGHEVLHAILFDLFEKPNIKNLENAVYRLERAYFGEDINDIND